jgi:HemX protein
MSQLLPDGAWLWISAMFYAAAFLTSTYALIAHRQRPRVLLIALIGFGLVAQTLGLHQRGLASSPPGCPLNNTFEIVQFVIWSFTILYAIVGSAFRVSVLGYFTAGLAAMLSVASLLFWYEEIPPVPITPRLGGNPWIEVHAALALFAYGTFGTLALTSLMFLLQNFSLKRKRVRGVFSILPPIVALETMNFRLLLTGIAVLSFSIAVGGFYYQSHPGSVGGTKLLISTVVWAAYVCVMLLRMRQVLVANALAWACLVLFGAALLTLPSINAGSHRSPATDAAAVSARHDHSR